MTIETKMLKVTKRNKASEDFDATKINRILSWATKDISGTNPSDIAMRAKLSIVDGISTQDIHQSLIDAASDMVDINNLNYNKVAARLFLYMLRKNVWGGKTAPRFFDLIKKNISAGVYDKVLLEKYSEDEINKLNELIDHDRDENYDYGGLVQLSEKYLIQNRKTKQIFETPQFQIMAIGMIGFQNENPNVRMSWIKRFYNDVSKFKINLPTPILSGARSITKSYSSCCLIDVLDTKESLFAANTAAGMVTCDKYGVGLNLSKLRPLRSEIKGGETLHSGVIAWLKMYQDTIHACQQGGARRGAGTVTFPIFHPEIMTILELKNNQGTHENRVPHIDYNITTSKIFDDRLKSNGNISLFGSHEAPEVYNSFGTEDFDEIYIKFENSNIPRISIPAREVFSKLFTESLETGRIYVMNIDQSNKYSPWLDTVQMSNLCMEILQALKAERFTNDPEAEIGVCILGAINMMKIKSDQEHRKCCELLVRFLDNIIDIQSYTIKACENFAKNKRSLGIGVTNLAAWLASHGFNHNSKESPQLISDFMEKQQYFLMEASCNIAKEKGAASHFSRSKYFNANSSPLDLYNKNVDKLLEVNKLEWGPLMNEIKNYGLRNMTLSAQMPCESSSGVQSTTNGMEPITALITRKTSKGKTFTQVAPNAVKWKNIYLKKSDISDNKGIIEINAAIVKWLDMSSSFNTYYNHSKYPEGMIPMSVLIKDHLYATHLGAKTFYYRNSEKKKDSLAVSQEEVEQENSCAGGACTL